MSELRLGLEIEQARAEGAVLDEANRVIASANLALGPDDAGTLRGLLRAVTAGNDVDPRRITRAVLGSTVALDAIEQRNGLRRIAVLRIGRPLTLALPPLASWPPSLGRAVSAGNTIVGGGAEYDGTVIEPLESEAISRFAAAIAEAAEGIAVTSVFSPVAPDQELEAAEIIHRELGASVPVSLSHELGTVGLLERENATVLSATLLGVVERLLESFGQALEDHLIDAELFLAQGDGTVMTPEHALRFPVYMLGSGPASAIRGGAWLTGVMDGVTLELDARSATVGALVNGRPRERTTPTEIAGIRTNFRVPDVVTLAIGDGEGAGEALAAALDSARRVLPLPMPLPMLVVVGSGASAAPHLMAAGETIVPGDGDVARAIGLVIAPAGGHSDRVCANRASVRATTMEAARADAIARAIHAGADPAKVQVVEVEEIPLTYLLDPPIRIIARAIGPRI
jgi:N-methylhydantoinase A/oxoprolinase/acetone carboxylase beta subunit